jgi:hypothetical protein
VLQPRVTERAVPVPFGGWMDGGSWKPEAGSRKNGPAEAVAAALPLFSLPSSANRRLRYLPAAVAVTCNRRRRYLPTAVAVTAKSPASFP